MQLSNRKTRQAIQQQGTLLAREIVPVVNGLVGRTGGLDAAVQRLEARLEALEARLAGLERAAAASWWERVRAWVRRWRRWPAMVTPGRTFTLTTDGALSRDWLRDQTRHEQHAARVRQARHEATG